MKGMSAPPVQLLRDSLGPAETKTGKPLWTCKTWPRADGGGSVYACIPNFMEVLGDFKSLQRAMNDFLVKHPEIGPPIRVDGQIGEPETWMAFQGIVTRLKLGGTPQSIDELAGRAGEFARIIAAAAGSGVNTTPDPVPQRPRETEQPTVDPSKGGTKWWVWALLGLGVVTVGGLTWYFVAKSGKKKKRVGTSRPALALSGGIDDDDDDEPEPDELDDGDEDNYHPLFGKVIDV